ncbi:unnamed protein product [Pleuronectes platessa]|uniref:Uncharacterized protein n=1 Tax=Pleuronectes platessa TaxID=8262 RepID=A0A9N7UW82_PLEPL|nr:unnamed protein product [Pleuronectes platessa]
MTGFNIEAADWAQRRPPYRRGAANVAREVAEPLSVIRETPHAMLEVLSHLHQNTTYASHTVDKIIEQPEDTFIGIASVSLATTQSAEGCGCLCRNPIPRRLEKLGLALQRLA